MSGQKTNIPQRLDRVKVELQAIAKKMKKFHPDEAKIADLKEFAAKIELWNQKP